MITDVDTSDEAPGAGPGAGGGGGAPTLPDTAMRSETAVTPTFGAVLLVATLGLGVRRCLRATAR